LLFVLDFSAFGGGAALNWACSMGHAYKTTLQIILPDQNPSTKLQQYIRKLFLQSLNMESEPIVPAEDDLSYIPTIQHSTEQSSLQVPTIRYTPSTAQSPSSIPLLSSSRTILSADATPFIQGIQYRATLVQQVHFQYPTPPTPPIEGCSSQELQDNSKPMQSAMDTLAITQGGPIENDGSKQVNPFPSLPTPPDVQELHQESHMQMNSLMPHHSNSGTTRFRMPPFNENVSVPMSMPFSKPPSHGCAQSVFCYSGPNDPKLMAQRQPPHIPSIPPLPPLLKDGEL